MSEKKLDSLADALKRLQDGTPPPPDAGLFGATIQPEDCRVVIIPVPWDATVSYRTGTSAEGGLARHRRDGDIAGRVFRVGEAADRQGLIDGRLRIAGVAVRDGPRIAVVLERDGERVAHPTRPRDDRDARMTGAAPACGLDDERLLRDLCLRARDVLTAFGKVAKLSSGEIPYPLFVFAAQLAWQFYASALAD